MGQTANPPLARGRVPNTFCARPHRLVEIPLRTATKAQDNPEAGPVLPGLLVDPDWLGDHVGHQRVRIVDLRDREAYDGGHIPGAVQLDLEDLGENRDGCDNVVLGPAEFGRLMARLGISNGDTVVAYDDHWGLPSARLVWALQLYGERAVSVLNGGWDRWQEEGRPVTLSSVTDEPGTDESLTEGFATQGLHPGNNNKQHRSSGCAKWG